MPEYSDEVREQLLEHLADGKFLIEIARMDGMPCVRQIKRWAAGADEFAVRMQEAREVGFEVESERLVEEVRTCEDAQRARVLFELLRYRLGKLSQGAFRERPTVGVAISVDGDAFAAFASALAEARSARASLANSTERLVVQGPPRPTDAAG